MNAWLLPFVLLLITLLLIVGVSWFRIRHQLRAQLTQLRLLRQEQVVLQGEHSQLKRYCASLVQGLEIPFLLCEADSSLVLANDAALRWFGFQSVEGRSILALGFSYELYLLLQRCLKRRAQVSAALQLPFPVERRVLATAWPLPSPFHPEAEVYAITLIDQTELHRLEQVRRDFVANVSHEFRTPLSSVRALAETMLQDSEMPAETRLRFLEMIVKETERLTRIADDLLILSQAEMERPRKEEIDLAAIARGVLAQLQPEAQAAQVYLRDELPPTLPMRGNRDQMVQVVLNLVDNAIKYNKPDGKVYVRGGVEGEEVWLEVEDEGIGILSEDLPRIFERFYRVDKARSRFSGGTGLGLSIVKHIVEAHGGTVEVQSEYRRGSRFRVHLPSQ